MFLRVQNPFPQFFLMLIELNVFVYSSLKQVVIVEHIDVVDPSCSVSFEANCSLSQKLSILLP
jgi:hypothetical protein